MEAKDKAIDIFKRYYCMENNSSKRIKCIEFQTAKQCALIAVDEIIEEVRDYCDYNFHQDRMTFFENVRFEIKKL